MKLSLKLIAENLKEYEPQLLDEETNEFEFKGVQVLTSPGEDLEKDILYVCMPRVLPRIKKAMLEDHCFVFKGNINDIHCKNKPHGIIINENSDLIDVVNQLISFFAELQTFAAAVTEAALSRRGYEPFFELAKKAFPNCMVFMSDSAYNIVAATKSSVENSSYVDAIFRRGYFSREDLNLMASRGYYDDERKYFRPVLYPRENTISGLPYMARSYRCAGVAISFIGCYVLEGEPSERDIAMFDCLAQGIDTYYDVSGIYNEGSFGKTQQLLDDLIHPKQDTTEYLHDRCDQLHIPYDGDFRVGIVQPENTRMIKVTNLVNQLNAHCPLANYGVYQYGKEILIIFKDWSKADVKTKATFHDDKSLLMGTLKQNKAYIGISLNFSNISKFAAAYQQAAVSVKLGRQKEPEQGAYFYSKYYLEDMLNNYSSIMPLEDIYTRRLDKLIDDNNCACSNIKLLYYYLCSERNISLTAKYIHMHRNSVIYRIQKIQELIDLDLDDPDIRLRLMISFKILEMTGRIPHWEKPRGEGSVSDSMEDCQQE